MSKPKRILVVDDEPKVCTTLQRLLESLNHEVEIALDGFEALAKLELGFDLVLIDIVMSGMDGFELVEQIRNDSRFANLPLIMATGLIAPETRIRAEAAGADDFITKPFNLTEVRMRTSAFLRMKESSDALKRHKIELEEAVEHRTAALRKALSNMVEAQRMIRQAHIETIHRLVVAAEYKDIDTAFHVQRMSHISALLARKIKLPPGEVELIKDASPMHDIGKIGVPEEILLKPGKLSDDEWKMMKQHTVIGSKILKKSTSKLLQAGEVIALAHHEKWDGSGYPFSLKGENIPLWGRICSIADVFDALTSKRPYKKAYPNDEALKIILDDSDKQYDPKLLDVFAKSIDEVAEIQERFDSKLINQQGDNNGL